MSPTQVRIVIEQNKLTLEPGVYRGVIIIKAQWQSAHVHTTTSRAIGWQMPIPSVFELGSHFPLAFSYGSLLMLWLSRRFLPPLRRWPSRTTLRSP